MKKLTAFLIILILGALIVQAQVAISTDGTDPDNSAMLDVKSTNKGMLVPRVALIGVENPISGTKPEGLLVWNTSTAGDYPAPGSPAEGDLDVSSTNHHIYCYLNGAWKQLD